MTSPEQTDVDGSDEADHDAAETALGAAIGAILLAELMPGPTSVFRGVKKLKSWDDRIDAAVGGALRAFMQRSASDLAADSKVAGASPVALQEAEEVYPHVLTWLQNNLAETLQHLTDDKIPHDEAAARVQSAAATMARSTAIYAKSKVREATAGKLGAVFKIWRTRHDEKVRSTHRELNGERVPFGSHFTLPDERTISYPGDPDADLDLVVNCRCHLVYRILPKEQVYDKI